MAAPMLTGSGMKVGVRLMLEMSPVVQPGASNSVFVGLKAMGSLALMHIAASEGISRPGVSRRILLSTSERRDVHW